MARNALKPAMAATMTLWSAVILSAVTDLTSGRLHGALVTGAACASIWLIANVTLDRAIRKMKSDVYQFDRGYDVAARAVVAGLTDVGRDPFNPN